MSFLTNSYVVYALSIKLLDYIFYYYAIVFMIFTASFGSIYWCLILNQDLGLNFPSLSSLRNLSSCVYTTDFIVY